MLENPEKSEKIPKINKKFPRLLERAGNGKWSVRISHQKIFIGWKIPKKILKIPKNSKKIPTSLEIAKIRQLIQKIEK